MQVIPDDFGLLPIAHPTVGKRKLPDKRIGWTDRKVLSPGSGSEVRIVFGSYIHEKAVKLRPNYRPASMGLRMRWGSNEGLDEASATGGNIQARSVMFIGADDEADETKREEEHRSKVLTHRDEVFSVFKLHLNLAKIEKCMGLGKNWLEVRHSPEQSR